jgi:hypothetical protein
VENSRMRTLKLAAAPGKPEKVVAIATTTLPM